MKIIINKNLIVDFLKANNLTKRAMANKSGISYATLNKILNADKINHMKAISIKRIIQFMGIKFSDLIEKK